MRSIFLLLLMGTVQAQVCVRPIYPFSTEEQVQVVTHELNKKGVQTTICGKTNQETEIWFYPLLVPMEGESQFWVNVERIRGGFTGTVSRYTPQWNDQTWTLSVHPNGGIRSWKWMTGYGLKSQSGRLGKWVGKMQKTR